MTGTPPDEQVVLVDPDGRPLGSASKAAVHGSTTPLHLGFSCYVVDADDRLLLTRRSRGKRTFPGVWTNSFCGHPAPGEPLGCAVRRRARDELGLEIGEPDLVLPSFRYRAEQDGVVELELCPVLLVRVDGTQELRASPAEVDDWSWHPWADVVTSIRAGRQVSQWCREQVEVLAPLGPPSAWPTASSDLLPTALRPPHVTGPSNVGQTLIGEAS